MSVHLASRVIVDGTEVLVEGTGDDTVLMLHGWPDTLALWDGTVAALRDGQRCVRLSLPGYDRAAPGLSAPCPLARITALLRAVADAVSPGRPVTLLVHDWGCVFGYEFALRHPERVARVIGVDVGDHNSPALQRALTPGQKFGVFAYQAWLAMAWQLRDRGLGGVADGMTRRMAGWLRYRGPIGAVHAGMNYPYAMAWLGTAGGLRGALPVRLPQPMLYLYGRRKPFMFHSPEWLAALQAAPGSAAVGLRTGHWVMTDAPERFHATVRAWLDGQPLPADDDGRGSGAAGAPGRPAP